MPELLTISESEADCYSLPGETMFSEAEEDQVVGSCSCTPSGTIVFVDDDWDRQMEEDILAGRLDFLSQAAIEEYRSGGTEKFPPDGE